jgi:hypothetical protein
MVRKKIQMFFLGFLLFLPTFLFSQSNAVIDGLLEEEKATYGKAVYMVLSAAELIAEDATAEEALSALEKTGWKVKMKPAEEPIQLGTYAYIVMRAFEIKGGLMYTLFPGPRYASRELGFKSYIKRDAGAYRTLSGREALRILGRVMLDRGA